LYINYLHATRMIREELKIKFKNEEKGDRENGASVLVRDIERGYERTK